MCCYYRISSVVSGSYLVKAGLLAGVVVEDLLCAAAEDDHLFAGLRVPMDGDDRTRLDGVQHPLGVVFRGIPEVVVLT